MEAASSMCLGKGAFVIVAGARADAVVMAVLSVGKCTGMLIQERSEGSLELLPNTRFNTDLTAGLTLDMTLSRPMS